jgi:Na+-transporting methylmalonyl-CoA/oxaloacetate decarboxylase beta subunit
MIDAFQSGFGSLIMGFSLLTIENILMIAVGCGLLYLGIKKEYEYNVFFKQILRIQFH